MSVEYARLDPVGVPRLDSLGYINGDRGLRSSRGMLIRSFMPAFEDVQVFAETISEMLEMTLFSVDLGIELRRRLAVPDINLYASTASFEDLKVESADRLWRRI